MVLLNEKKFACETCIKGHRSSGCKHTDRPLYEIKKKGRPVTQCRTCRELRKTKQIHVKCICQKGDIASSCSTKGSNKKNAAFPNGLPEALEDPMAPQVFWEGISSDLDHGTGTRRPEREVESTTRAPHTDFRFPSPPSPPPVEQRMSRQVPNRISELRPVLPKLTRKPSITGMSRQHPFDSKLYSPYGRAYDYAHPYSHTIGTIIVPRPSNQIPGSVATVDSLPLPPLIHPRSPSRAAVSGLDNTNVELWTTSPMTLTANKPGSFFGCQDGCACSSCMVQKPNNYPISSEALPRSQQATFIESDHAPSSYSPLDEPSNTALSIHDSDDDAIDEWIRQMQGPLPSQSFGPPSSFRGHNELGAPPKGSYYSSSKPGRAFLSDGRIRIASDGPSYPFDDDLAGLVDPATLDPSMFGFGVGYPMASTPSMDYIDDGGHRLASMNMVDLSGVIPHSCSPSSSSETSSISSDGHDSAGEMLSMSMDPHDDIPGVSRGSSYRRSDSGVLYKC